MWTVFLVGRVSKIRRAIVHNVNPRRLHVVAFSKTKRWMITTERDTVLKCCYTDAASPCENQLLSEELFVQPE